MRDNSEGIALVMAVQERNWIAEHFGLPNPDADAGHSDTRQIPPTPQSPRSPVGGRLGEKLRGLKLVTNASDFTASSGKLFLMNPDLCVFFFLFLSRGRGGNEELLTVPI